MRRTVEAADKMSLQMNEKKNKLMRFGAQKGEDLKYASREWEYEI